jgi:hypothetical protein
MVGVRGFLLSRDGAEQRQCPFESIISEHTCTVVRQWLVRHVSCGRPVHEMQEDSYCLFRTVQIALWYFVITVRNGLNFTAVRRNN